MVISWVFKCKFLQIHITSVSGWLHFTLKICQIVAGTSTISQFHEFLNLVFGGFLCYDPTVLWHLGGGYSSWICGSEIFPTSTLPVCAGRLSFTQPLSVHCIYCPYNFLFWIGTTCSQSDHFLSKICKLVNSWMKNKQKTWIRKTVS